MRKIFNKIFRYRLVSIYFILSQLVILTAIFGVLNTINKAYAKEKEKSKEKADGIRYEAKQAVSYTHLRAHET